MITFFTTFKGINTAEENAIKSWLCIHPESEVILFTEQKNHAVLNDSRIIVCNELKKDVNNKGLPFLNFLFEQASRRAKYKLLCYCNADIILTESIVPIFEKLYELTSSFLAVSQRTDVLIDSVIDFTDPSENRKFHDTVKENGKIHPPYGSDIFVFPKHQYTTENMPDMLVGRPGWDNWMIYDARKRFNKLVDIKASDSVIHQDHDAKYNGKNVQDQVNYYFLPQGHWYTFILTYCNFYMDGASLHKNIFFPKGGFGNHETRVRLRWEMEFNRGSVIYWFYLLLFNLSIRNII